MTAYLAVLVVILVLEGGVWLVTREPGIGWLLLLSAVVGLALPVLRVLLRRGAPDDKFPWE